MIVAAVAPVSRIGDVNNPIEEAERTALNFLQRLSGIATLTEEGANEQIDRLARKYKGLDSYPWHKPEETRVSVRISPTWIEARGLE